MSRHRIALFGGTLAFYLAIVFAVLIGSWLVTLDWKVMLFRPYQQWPGIHAFLDYYVVLGQRGPTAVMVACWLGWRSWRQHTLRPLLTLGASLLLLNLTVGAVKLGLGGSARTTRPRSALPSSSPAAIYSRPGTPPTRS